MMFSCAVLPCPLPTSCEDPSGIDHPALIQSLLYACRQDPSYCKCTRGCRGGAGLQRGGSRLGDAQSLIISPATVTTLGRDKDMILQIFFCLTKYLAMLECQLTSKSDKVSE